MCASVSQAVPYVARVDDSLLQLLQPMKGLVKVVLASVVVLASAVEPGATTASSGSTRAIRSTRVEIIGAVPPSRAGKGTVRPLLNSGKKHGITPVRVRVWLSGGISVS